jgi:hypothetical protein
MVQMIYALRARYRGAQFIFKYIAAVRRIKPTEGLQTLLDAHRMKWRPQTFCFREIKARDDDPVQPLFEQQLLFIMAHTEQHFELGV